MSTYFDLVEGFEATTAQIRSRGPAHDERAREEIAERAIATLVPLGAESFEKLMVWHTDKLYRLLNHVDILDQASFVFLSAIGAAFDVVARERGRAMAYLVDNAIPYDRMKGLQAAFRALRFVVASPELVAIELGKHDGLGEEEVLAKHFARYAEEASAVALQLVAKVVEERRHFIWLSGESSADVLRAVAANIAQLPYVGVFRNDAPVDGTEVQIFQAAGTSDALAL
jgi:hypothetical protein